MVTGSDHSVRARAKARVGPHQVWMTVLPFQSEVTTEPAAKESKVQWRIKKASVETCLYLL